MTHTSPLLPAVPRKEAMRMVGAHATTLTAIALAADTACADLCDSLYKTSLTPRRLDTKTRGLLVAVMWTEGVRDWVQHVQPPGVRIFDPYGWTELVLYDTLHVRVERDQGYPVSDRRRARRQQLPDPLLPVAVLGMGQYGVTNVDLTATLSERGRITGVIAQARHDRHHVWPPSNIDLKAARRLLQSWTARPHAVPWLASVERAAVLAEVDSILQERDRLRAEVTSLRKQVKTLEGRAGGPTVRSIHGSEPGRLTYHVPPKEDADDSAASTDN